MQEVVFCPGCKVVPISTALLDAEHVAPVYAFAGSTVRPEDVTSFGVVAGNTSRGVVVLLVSSTSTPR